MADLNVDIYTQVSVDEYAAIGDGDTPARITHAVVEVLRDGDPDVSVTHAVAEVLRDGDPNAWVTHVVAEVLRANEYTFGNTFDAVTVTDVPTVSLPSGYDYPLALSHTNTPAYDYLSQGTESNPVEVDAVLNYEGGDVTTDSVSIYLIAGESFDMVVIDCPVQDIGVVWEFSEDDVDFDTNLTLNSVTAGATQIYCRAVVANDESITEDKLTADVRVIGWK